MTKKFTPPFYMRSAFAQTLLASSKLGTYSENPMLNAARETILNIGNVCLQGFYSPQTNQKPLGVVMLLHGWEGSVNSAYILRTGKFLYESGYSVFRLNFRDHGETHHLNPGLFYAILLDEVFGAVQQVSQYESRLPFYLAGFSMGGNFALRIARRTVETPIPNLKHIFSISPVLDPEKSTYAIDKYPFLQKYFRKKWSNSMRKKQSLYPDQYDFNDVFPLESIAGMTEILLKRYTEFQKPADYFRKYAVTGDALAHLNVPLTIVTAADDPIIPIEDFYELKLNPATELIIHPHGGHNGFLESLTGRTWYQKKMLEVFSE